MYIETVPNRNSPARDPAARGLSRGRQGAQAHPGQPVALGRRSSSSTFACCSRAAWPCPVGRRGLHHRAHPAPRPCGRRAGRGARLGRCDLVWLSARRSCSRVLLAMLVARVICAGLQAGHPPPAARRHRQLARWAACWAWANAAPTSCTGRWTGCMTRSRPSSGAWRASTWWAPPWCCTTSPRPG